MAEKKQQIDLMQLPLPHLNQLKETLEQEVDVLQNSLQQLKLAQGKFVDSLESLNKFKPENEGKDILVPLTSSLYVPGQLSDVKTVLIDIGTGYYVEKSVEKSKEYFKRKIDFMTKQMDKAQPAMAEKFKLKQAVMEVMNIKYQAQLAQMQQNQAVKS
ncbi:prefoldin subunit 5-like [Anneissia japonica]|uniref:prefoldin subunit 5-like n=1 Tax=Anneissia japonica TaxID=1529436 RepID=UPI0014257F43|nr:prefoldin subunit 5-like [Anneissia japonica]